METNKEIVTNVDKALGREIFEGTYNHPRNVAVKRVLLEDVGPKPDEEVALRKLNHLNVIKLFHAESDSTFR